jgi:hypothetical protein
VNKEKTKNMKSLILAAGLVLACLGSAKATAFTTVPSTAAPAAYATVPSSITWQAADAVNGNSFTNSGRELLIAWNSDTLAHTVTVASVADASGRTGDSTKNINGGSYYVWQLFPLLGWNQTDGTVHATASDATVKFVVIHLP